MTKTLQSYDSFFVLRSLSPYASEIHFVAAPRSNVAAPRSVDAMMMELTTFVQSCLEVLGGARAEITRLGEDERWSGIRVAIDDALLDTIARQVCPRLHDTLAGWMRGLYPGIDVVWMIQWRTK